MNEQQLEALLGLTNREARVFFALLKGVSKPSAICKATGIPQSKIYVTLQNMQTKIGVVKNGRNDYSLSPEQASKLIERMKNDAEECVEFVERTVAKLVSAPAEPHPSPEQEEHRHSMTMVQQEGANGAETWKCTGPDCTYTEHLPNGGPKS